MRFVIIFLSENNVLRKLRRETLGTFVCHIYRSCKRSTMKKRASSRNAVVSKYFPAVKIPRTEKASECVLSISPKQARLLQEAELEGQTLSGDSGPSVGQQRLSHSFFDVPCEDLARALLGKVLVRSLQDGTVLKGRIVETESYLGLTDKASHSYSGRITSRSVPMFMKPGTIYVFFTYGMYFCFNISSRGDGAVVLIRALDPLEGLEHMQQQRATMKKTSDPQKKPKWKDHELCNGPSKLCRCLDINIELCNKRDLSMWDGMWVEEDDVSRTITPRDIVTSTRIGIDSFGEECASKPLRFYLLKNKSVSRVDKRAEQSLAV